MQQRTDVLRLALTATRSWTPESFVWGGKYFYQVAPPGDVNLNDRPVVEERFRKAVSKHLLESEHIRNFAILDMDIRRVSRSRDAALLKVNPGAHFVAMATVRTAKGKTLRIPAVMNCDGRVYVDPRIRF